MVKSPAVIAVAVPALVVSVYRIRHWLAAPCGTGHWKRPLFATPLAIGTHGPPAPAVESSRSTAAPPAPSGRAPVQSMKATAPPRSVAAGRGFTALTATSAAGVDSR